MDLKLLFNEAVDSYKILLRVTGAEVALPYAWKWIDISESLVNHITGEQDSIENDMIDMIISPLDIVCQAFQERCVQLGKNVKVAIPKSETTIDSVIDTKKEFMNAIRLLGKELEFNIDE